MKRAPRAPRPVILHPLAGCTWRRFWQEYLSNGPYTLASLPSRLCALASVTLRIPHAAMESWRHDKAIRNHKLAEPPVFIIGHWRSGTTHLHNILSQDPRFAYLTFFQAVMPHDFLGRNKVPRALIQAIMPKNRGMDNVRVNLDVPQEEEMALGIVNRLSFFNCFYFPRRLLQSFRQSVLMEDLSARQISDFKAAYSYLLRKISYAHGGIKQVLCKNPASTARIPLLLELFPEARFIHMVRNPHEVFYSMQRLWKRMLAGFSWHKRDNLDLHETTLGIYESVMRRYLEDRKKIPPGHLVEVRYEDLDRAPLQTVAAIYDKLDMPNADSALSRISEYCSGLSGYQKNHHIMNLSIKSLVAERWKFAFDAWRYDY